MIVEFVEVRLCETRGGDKSYLLKECFINPEEVSLLREDDVTLARLNAGLLPENLDRRQRFTKIYLNNRELTVVGDPRTVGKKLNIDTRTLLRG